MESPDIDITAATTEHGTVLKPMIAKRDRLKYGSFAAMAVAGLLIGYSLSQVVISLADGRVFSWFSIVPGIFGAGLVVAGQILLNRSARVNREIIDNRLRFIEVLLGLKKAEHDRKGNV